MKDALLVNLTNCAHPAADLFLCCFYAVSKNQTNDTDALNPTSRYLDKYLQADPIYGNKYRIVQRL